MTAYSRQATQGSAEQGVALGLIILQILMYRRRIALSVLVNGVRRIGQWPIDTWET